MEQRIDIVRELRGEHGLNFCLEAFSVPRTTFFRRERQLGRKSKDDAVINAIREIIVAHPGYGWRRLQTELFDAYDLRVNHKRLKRLMRAHALGLPRHVVQKRRTGPAGLLEHHTGDIDLVRGRTFGPLEAFSTDFTEVVYAGGRKAWLMAIVDLNSKLVPGWRLGPSRNRPLAIGVLEDCVACLGRLGVAPVDRIVHHDKDSVYTSYAWLAEVLLRQGMRVSYSENGARHNPWIESLWGRAKAEIGSRIIEAPSINALTAVVDEHFAYYNTTRRHSALGNISPVQYLNSRGHRLVSAN